MTVVLVTGASGFIGSHLVRRCIREGYPVRALVRKGNGAIAGLERDGVDVVEGDIRDAEAVKRAVNGCDLVFHAAALTSDWGDLREFRNINVGGTRHLCEAALREHVKRVVYISSFECFNHSRFERIDEQTPFAIRDQSYADTKIGGTRTVLEYAGMGLNATIVYPVWVYGPDDRTLFPLLADSIRRRQLFYWARNARMSLIYIDNLVDLLMLAALHPDACNEGFLASDGDQITLEELCTRIAKGIHAPPPSRYLPYRFVYLLAGAMESLYRMIKHAKRPLLTRQAVVLLASRAVIDASKARRILGWSPQIALDEGIRRTLKWLMTVDPAEWKQK
ncbi:MAG: SDR family NAD(P)-dependent oxidoreductase [Chlorobiaceae bacterium]|nr:SDR family NAD(P)-dependent oxidoreductase [Chlorobiaceae bacterium]